MSNSFSRRDLFRNATAFAASAGIASAVSLNPFVSVFASEPIKRNGTPKFKFSVAAYSYRAMLTNAKSKLSEKSKKPDHTPKLTLHDFIEDCAKWGCEGTELTSYYFPADVSDDELRATRQHCFRLGLEVSGTAVSNEFAIPPGLKRDAEIAEMKKWIDRAAILGAPVIRIFAGHVAKDQDPKEAHKLFVSGIEESCDYAGKRGVHLALENHGGPTATAKGLLEIVKDVKSPWFGVNLDSGNFHSKDPYAELEQIVPYAINVQIKVMTSGPDKKKVPSDMKRLAKIMRAANYRGYIVLEYEESENPRTACPKFLDEIRSAFA